MIPIYDSHLQSPFMTHSNDNHSWTLVMTPFFMTRIYDLYSWLAPVVMTTIYFSCELSLNSLDKFCIQGAQKQVLFTDFVHSYGKFWRTVLIAA